MSLRDLKAELATRFHRAERTLQRQAKSIRDNHGPMSRELAWAVLAQDVGVDAAAYLDNPPDAAEVRKIRHERALLDSPEARKRVVSPARTILVRIGTDFELKDPLLPESVLNDARAMADVYPLLYVFENSVREVICRVLEKAHGPNWWSACAPAPVQRRVEGRKAKEGRNAWHSKRGAHEIYYTNMPDLKSIITSKANWPAFQPLFQDQAWIIGMINAIEMSRNVVAHNNPLEKTDIGRINLYFGDWSKQIQSVKHLIV